MRLALISDGLRAKELAEDKFEEYVGVSEIIVVPTGGGNVLTTTGTG